MKKSILAILTVIALGACSSGDDKSKVAYPSAPVAQALPFTFADAFVSDAYVNNISVANVTVDVDGGTAPQWSATAAAIAEHVASYGVDSVEVSVRRTGLVGDVEPRFREVSHAFFSPDPARDVWSQKQPWDIETADPGRLTSQRDVDIYNFYNDLYDSLVGKGMDTEKADKKAGAVTAKKFALAPDWRLPVGNLKDPVQRSSFNVDTSAADRSFPMLDACLKGKRAVMAHSCA